MKTTIRLAECQNEAAAFMRWRWQPEVVAQAISALVAANLRWDNRRGQMYMKRGLVENYSNPSEFEPHAELRSVIEWEFSRYVGNACSRIVRGFPAV